jgi:arsenate reductase (glutaredoxin)
MIIYGIKNCSTVKSTLDGLKKNKIEFKFHDYKKSGITATKLSNWSKEVGWEVLVNKHGTTLRQLNENSQKGVANEKAAIALMLEKNSVIKHPVIKKEGKVILLGFDAKEYKEKLQSNL